MKIVVLAGGTSTERDVSLSSGSKIMKALKKKGHQVILLDVYLGYQGHNMESVFEEDSDCMDEISGVLEEAPDIEKIKAMRADGGKSFFGPFVIDLCSKADIVFMALHGENGENGKIQAAFDLLGIRYTGTDYVSSALCMDKALTKELFQIHGIKTPAGCVIEKNKRKSREIGLPCVVKVACGGSSIGVYIVHTENEYENALTEAFAYEDTVIVEQYIEGREFSVGVIEGRALPVIEIAPVNGFYDYKNKYQAGSTIETCPADLDPAIAQSMRASAEMAYKALRLKTYARMDFMQNGQGEHFCLEANTLPGMTPTSLLPQEALAEGMDYESLCEHIIQISVKKYE